MSTANVRSLHLRSPITGKDSLRIARPVNAFSMDDVFGSGLQKSGSIVRGFTVGSNRDLSLNSGLRLQLSGKILSDVEITAALTDENTPIQPEGTTQTLQEFDKVFVEINAKRLSATLGDFVLDLSGTEFARLSRKLQGAKGTAQYRFGSIHPPAPPPCRVLSPADALPRNSSPDSKACRDRISSPDRTTNAISS